MVRIWRLSISILDRQHLLAEHFETHIISNALMRLHKGIKAGWQRHPNTLRYKDSLSMLISRHSEQVEEMEKRGYNHKSPLPEDFIKIALAQCNNKIETFSSSYEEYMFDLIELDDRKGILGVW